MRESLTILATLLIGLLTAALVGPRFVDWTAHRDWVEAQLQHATGVQLRVGGDIDLTLLPVPRLRVTGVSVRDDAAPGLSFEAKEASAELAITSLLRGEWRFTDASLEAPTLHVILDASGGVALPAGSRALPSDIQFDSLVFHGAMLVVDDPARQGRFLLEDIDLEASAASLSGPYKGAGAFRRGDERVPFRFNTSAREGDRLRVKLAVDAVTDMPRAELDGALNLAAGPGGGARAVFDGGLTLSGALQTGVAKPAPWRLAGRVKAEPGRIAFDALDLRAGEDDRAFQASGTGVVTFGKGAQGRLDLTARQVDLDRLLGESGDNPDARTRLMDDLSRLATDNRVLSRLPFPMVLAMSSPAVGLGGETLTDVSAELKLQAGAPVGLIVQANGPGRSRLSFDGRVETGVAAAVMGRIEASARDTIRLADWLAPPVPLLADALRAAPFRTVDIAGDAELSFAGIKGNNLKMKIDRSSLTGAIVYTRSVGDERARFFADLTSDSLDLDGLPDLSRPAALTADMDLSLSLKARAVRLARVGDGMIDAGRISMRVSRAGSDVSLDTLAIENLGGATVSMTGSLVGGELVVEGRMDAARLTDLAETIRRVAPGPAASLFSSRAVALSPVKAFLHVDARTAADGSLAVTNLALDGTARGTRIQASVRPPSAANPDVTTGLNIEAPDAPTLLRQLGFDALAISGYGKATIKGSATGRPGEAFDTVLDAQLAGANLGFRGKLDGNLLNPHAAGALTLRAADLSPLLQIAALGTPDVTQALPLDATAQADAGLSKVAFTSIAGKLAGASVAGGLTFTPSLNSGLETRRARLDGALKLDRFGFGALATLALGPVAPARNGAVWPDSRFGRAMLDGPDADIAIETAAFDLAEGWRGSDASLHLRLGPSVVEITDVAMKLAGGAVSGKLALRRNDATGFLSTSLKLDNVAFDRPTLSGQVSGTIDVTASGDNPRAMVSGLAGGGSLQIANIRIARTDPAALARVIALTDREGAVVDEPNLNTAFGLELDKGALTLGTRSFDASLAAGVLRIAPASRPTEMTGSWYADLSAALDFRTFAIDERVNIAATASPKEWRESTLPSLNVIWKGPLAAPLREVEASSTINGLSARAIARENARIEALEADIRERAAFNRRVKGLQFMRQREQEVAAFEVEQERLRILEEKRKAEEEKRRLEDEKRKADEAARQAAIEAARIERERRAAEAARANAPPQQPSPTQQFAPAPPAQQTPAPADIVAPPVPPLPIPPLSIPQIIDEPRTPARQPVNP